MLAIFAPMDIEVKPLRDQLEIDTTMFLHPGRIWHGRIGTHEICLARTGLGKRAMEQCATHCFATFRPTAALLIGFAGATTPHLHLGDLVLSKTIVDNATGVQLSPSEESMTRGLEVSRTAHIEAHQGTIVTVDAAAGTPHEKAFLGTQHEALAVDMEGSGFAAAAEAAGIPWLIARGISDPMDYTLPDNFSPIREDGTLSLVSFISYMVRNLRVVPQLSSLHMAATKARESTIHFAKAWLVS